MWRYMWRTTPVHRWEMTGSSAEDSPPELPEEAELDAVQPAGDGHGPLFHRVYRTSIRGAQISAEQLMRQITADLDVLAPSEMAKFQKVHGEEGEMRVGDEYVVRMPGPWDGPVRVVSVTADAFRLVTLEDHLEAGQIEFRVHATPRSIEFVIESWARSGDRLSSLLYGHLRAAKEVQLHMWTSVITRVVELARGRMHGGIRVVTRRVEEDDDSRSPHRGSRSRLAGLHGREVNFDASRSKEYTREAGWHVDDMSAELPGEPSGDPVEGGSWQTACRLIDDYQLADPGTVRAAFDHDAPLEGRDMLLEIRFLVLRIGVGVRVGTPYDEVRVVDGRRARVFGWSYRTLEGHFEMGEMHYEVWKWLDDGDVEFRLRAYSHSAASGPLWLRLGFRLLGRRQQLEFYRNVCRRARRLTESQLELADVRTREAGS